MKNKFHETRIKSERLSYNKAISRTKKQIAAVSIGAISVFAGIQASSLVSDQATADVNTTFQVNVVESLSVAITTPTEGDSGGIGTFLRNAVGLEVSANSGNGFTASMYSKGSTNLTNTTSGNSETLPTLSNSTTRGAFPANYWGYSLGEYKLDGASQGTYTLNGHTYGETEPGNGNSNYYPLVSTSASPITIMDGATGSKKTGSQNIYFGAKGGVSQASGTYEGTVVISVITGAVSEPTNPATPVNPATDNTSTANPTYAETYGPSGNQGWTTYTTTSSDTTAGTNTTTTEISDGDTRSSYQAPAGVIENTYSNISNSTPLATGLAVTAAVAASSGYMFFIAANRRERDEDEEEA